MFAMVVLPRYGELFGRSGSQREVAGLAALASELLAAATSLSAAVGLVRNTPSARSSSSRELPATTAGLIVLAAAAGDVEGAF